MLMRHLMTRNVTTLREGMKCRDAMRIFRRQGIRHAPVVDGKRLLGVVSERDLLRQLPNTVMQLEDEGGWNDEQATVGVAMTRDPLTCAPNDPIDQVANHMLCHRVSCLPVVEEDELVGIVTSSDLFRGFASTTAGQEHGRVSFMVPKRVGRKGFDPVLLSTKLGLRVTSLISYTMDNGADLFLMQVDASANQIARLVAQAAKQGALNLGSPAPEDREDRRSA